MIIVRNRELIIPRNEAFIGTEYDRDSENRYFKIDRMLPSQIDLSGFTFVLDVVKSSGATDSLATDKEIFDDYLVLRVDMTGLPAGNTRIQLRASDTSGRRWSSAEAVLYVMDSISNPGSVTPSTTLTELEQIETRIEASEAARIASESARVLAEGAREDAEAERAEAETERAADYAEMKQDFSGYIDQAEEKAKLSESWAVGGTGIRSGEDTNNSKYFSEQSAEASQNASQSAIESLGYKNDAMEAAEAAARIIQPAEQAETGDYLHKGSNGNWVGSKSIPYLTTTPTSINNDGIKIVVLSAAPATFYDGYLYIITG